MDKICPHTEDICPVLDNLERISEADMTHGELITLDGISKAVIELLRNGSCEGSYSQNGDDTDPYYSGITSYCQNSNVPEVSEKIDEKSEPVLLGGSELFEIENISKTRGH